MKDAISSWIITFCSSGAFLFALWSRITKNALLSVAISGYVIMGISFVVILGHLLAVKEMYRFFGEEPGMAVETAIVFGIIGMGKVTMASKLRSLERHK